MATVRIFRRFSINPHLCRIGVALCLCFLLGGLARADRYTLIVGNNSYPNFSADQQLSGCESDARMLHDTLTQKLGIPQRNIRMLIGKEATYQGIHKGLDWLFSSGKSGDSLLFYYSGHGAQIRDEDGDETEDHLDEVLCPYDFKFLSGRRGHNAVTDDELNAIIKKRGKDREFVAVYDCCHSGTGLRALFSQRHVKYLTYDGDDEDRQPEPTGTLTRGMFHNTYVPPPAQDTGEAASGFMRTRRLSEEISPAQGDWATAPSSPQMTAEGVILIAAARDYELAAENIVRVSPSSPPEVHGILTLELCRYFYNHPKPNQVTYGDLKGFLDRPIVQGNNTQNPQVESTDPKLLERPFLGGARGT
ncbi:caspase family protein, partial [bacterium]|nr:caspase family protein [bacterium]